MILPVLLDADPSVAVPWSVIIALGGGVFSVVSFFVAYAYKSDNKANRIRTDTALEEVRKLSSSHDALKVALADERTERIRLEGQMLSMKAEDRAREEMRDRMVTQHGFEERTDKQDALLGSVATLVEAIARKTGSMSSMAAARASGRDERRDPTDPPEPLPRLPQMRERLPSRRGPGE